MPTENEISMLNAARAAGISSRDELANLMAQLSHESGGFAALEESFRYTRGIDFIPVRSAFREGREALDSARLEALAGRPQELARLMYGGRMGNDDVGDGYLYRGRGFIMLTGEENYRTRGAATGLDLVANPDLAAELGNSSRIALSYWQDRVSPESRDDVSAATRDINGGDNGLEDRYNRFDAWYALLTPEFIAELDAGRVRPGRGVGPLTGQPAMADGYLRRGESGDEVARLRADLRALDLRDDRGREIGESGAYDHRVEQAVRGFQAQQSLPVNGRAGSETLEALRQLRQLQEEAPLRETAPIPGANELPPVGTDREMERQRMIEGDRPRDNSIQAGPMPITFDQSTSRSSSPDTDMRVLDDPLYVNVRAAVRRTEAAMAKGWDDNSERLSASMYGLAREKGFGPDDGLRVAFNAPTASLRGGELVFLQREGAGVSPDPYANRAQMTTQDALANTSDATLRVVAARDAGLLQTQQTAQQLEQLEQQRQSESVWLRS